MRVTHLTVRSSLVRYTRLCHTHVYRVGKLMETRVRYTCGIHLPIPVGVRSTGFRRGCEPWAEGRRPDSRYSGNLPNDRLIKQPAHPTPAKILASSVGSQKRSVANDSLFINLEIVKFTFIS